MIDETRAPRNAHESQAEAVLNRLRVGPLTKMEWEATSHGKRLAPAVDRLRNGHGFMVMGSGTSSMPYEMPYPDQMPTLAYVTDTLKAAYYNSRHWIETRRRRLEIDNRTCVLCHFSRGCFSTVVHHTCYELFQEDIHDLMTLCEVCHESIHETCRLKFPSGMKLEHAQILIGDYCFDDWLLPPVTVRSQRQLF